jgi:hypothetical protein
MDVPTGVRNFSIGLIVLWFIYFFGAFFGGGGVGGFRQTLILCNFYTILGNWVWAIIWCSVNILCYLGVIYGQMKSTKTFLLPALFISVFDVIVGVIQGIINFFFLNIFG